jgi:ornithine carbamoyltransferase
MGGMLILDSKANGMNHLTSLLEADYYSVVGLIKLASALKSGPQAYSSALQGKTLGMLFEKPSLRTRVSFEAGIKQLGGNAVFINSKDTTFKEKESVADTAGVLSRYCDILMARLYSQEDIEEFAKHSFVPVINGLTDLFHPCQILADLLTIFEKKGRLSGLRVAFVGDGNNNIVHDLLLGCCAAGIDVSIGCPEENRPQAWIVDAARQKAKISGSELIITGDPKRAVEHADVVYTDTWMSYHIPENEKDLRMKIFGPYQVDKKMMSFARKDAIFMHCLPAERGYEVSAEVMDGPQSVVLDQAENRMHMQKAVMLSLLGKM